MTQESLELKQVELKWEDHSLTDQSLQQNTTSQSWVQKKKTSGSNSLKGSFVINLNDFSLRRLSQITTSSLQKHSGAEVN